MSEDQGKSIQKVIENSSGKTVFTVAVDKEDREMALKVIEDCEYAMIASINPDSTPYCIPVYPVLVGDYIYFHGTKRGQKVSNIMLNPHVCISAVGQSVQHPETYTADFISTIVSGTISIVEDDAEKIKVLHKICLKYAHSNMQMFDEFIGLAMKATGVYKITTDKITHKLHTAPEAK
jgi:nitroimidazol reductase NimA-like FMN-containing flavoprotein (pyridoxamine 5'-phosphate oxidase superfamily)